MGYVRKKKVFVLKFEDPELAGLEVRATSTSLGSLLELVSLSEIGKGKRFDMADVARLDEVFLLFASCLTSWNMEEEDGTPIGFEPRQILVKGDDATAVRMETPEEAKLRALKAQDTDFVMELIVAWMDGVMSISDPLSKSSNSGAPLEVPPLTMEPL